MQSEYHDKAQLCQETLLAAELFSMLTEEDKELIIYQLKFLLSHE